MYEQQGQRRLTAADAVETPQPLSLTQRLNRLRYCCYNLTGGLIATLTILLLFVLSRSVWVPESLVVLFYGAMALLWLAALVWLVGLGVRRLHDCNRAGWWFLLMLVPVVNFALVLYLLLAPGTAGENRFGGPNPPNGALVQIFGSLWWLLSLLGVAANGVMLITAPGTFLQFTGELEQLEQGRALLEQMPD